MRLALVGLFVGGGLGLSLLFGWSWSASAPATAADSPPWQLRELVFLKAAYDRIQQDLARQPQGAASLQAEQDRIVRQMAETARLLPADAVPAELRELLAATGAPAPAEDASLSQLIEAVASETQETPDLRAGLGGVPQPVAEIAEFAIDPELRRPIGRPPVRRKAPAVATAKSR